MHCSRNFTSRGRRENGSVIVLLLVVLAAVGVGWWLLKSSRDRRETEGRAFADQAMQHVVLQRDQRFLDFYLSRQAQQQYPPSFRMRLMDYVREPGNPDPKYQMKGQVTFTQQFFEPNGTFIGEFAYPTGPAYLEVQISHPGALWQIDAINWTWNPPAPTPTPVPLVSATPTPSPTPSPTPTPRKKH
jgi:hypothetical protein